MITEENLFGAVDLIPHFTIPSIRNRPEEGLALSMYAELQLWFWVSLVPRFPTTSLDSVHYPYMRDQIYPLHLQKKVSALTPQTAKITNKRKKGSDNRPKANVLIVSDTFSQSGKKFDVFCNFCRSRISL